MTQLSKIKKLGLEKDVIRLRGRGLGSREIAKQLSKESGEYISHMSIVNFLNSSEDIIGEIGNEQKSYKEEILFTVRDVLIGIGDVNDILMDRFYQLSENGSVEELVMVAEEIRKQAELVHKIGYDFGLWKINSPSGFDISIPAIIEKINKEDVNG